MATAHWTESSTGDGSVAMMAVCAILWPDGFTQSQGIDAGRKRRDPGGAGRRHSTLITFFGQGLAAQRCGRGRAAGAVLPGQR